MHAKLTYFEVIVLRLSNQMNIELECDGLLWFINRRVSDVLTPPKDGKFTDLAAPPKEEKGDCVATGKHTQNVVDGNA